MVAWNHQYPRRPFHWAFSSVSAREAWMYIPKEVGMDWCTERLIGPIGWAKTGNDDEVIRKGIATSSEATNLLRNTTRLLTPPDTTLIWTHNPGETIAY